MDICIRNARVLMVDGSITVTDIALSAGLIAAVGTSPSSRTWDAEGLLLFPGIVDLHGDLVVATLVSGRTVFASHGWHE